ncbi:MAG: DUF58 domain-containing protein, partial [Fimbriiglobus sp.]
AAERVCDTAPKEIGDSVEVVVRVRNTGTLLVGWVLVEDMAVEKGEARNRITLKGSRIRVFFLKVGQAKAVKYRLTFVARGYFPVGPCVAETGDVFGFHRRHRVLTTPAYVLVYPKILPLPGYDFASKRPIGEVRLANRLFEDPTRTAGVRPYQLGDPLQRVHWRATARTGQLHSRVYEPTSLAGATLLIDFHTSGFPKKGEPERSDLVVTAACSIANAVTLLNQSIGLASNGRDAAERIRDEALSTTTAPAADADFETRTAARARFEIAEKSDRLRPVVVPTRRGIDQFQLIREALARLELTDGLTFPQLILEVGPRLPRDATVIAVLGAVPVDSAVALGHLRKRGFAVSALLIGIPDEEARAIAFGRLVAEGVRDVRVINTEAELQTLGDRAAAGAPAEYGVAVKLA